MQEENYNLIDIIKHIFTHKSLVNYGYFLMFIRVLYAIIYPFIASYKLMKYLFTYKKPVKDKKGD
ncbi:hypothetical protein AL503_002275 [Staphylococcus haemolyticus]|uniref:Uncharacterized protein n=1 Tax=Staphylococcus haemolyticus TaxID=1283 RepID=A0A2K0AXA4_STAHA|nr:hypothetical protein AL503_002275 [Staphylococcus haemolyticus]